MTNFLADPSWASDISTIGCGIEALSRVNLPPTEFRFIEQACDSCGGLRRWAIVFEAVRVVAITNGLLADDWSLQRACECFRHLPRVLG